eukprot:9716-Heterococcus_DN1.PRE.2
MPNRALPDMLVLSTSSAQVKNTAKAAARPLCIWSRCDIQPWQRSASRSPSTAAILYPKPNQFSKLDA